MDYAFWSTLVGARSNISLSPKFPLKISNVCIASFEDDGGLKRTSIKLRFDEANDNVHVEKDTPDVVLCVLSPEKNEHAVVDIILPADVKCEIFSDGPCGISLSGNYISFVPTAAQLDAIINHSQKTSGVLQGLGGLLEERVNDAFTKFSTLPTSRKNTRIPTQADSAASIASTGSSTSSATTGERSSARIAGLKRREPAVEAGEETASNKRPKVRRKSTKAATDPEQDASLMPPPAQPPHGLVALPPPPTTAPSTSTAPPNATPPAPFPQPAVPAHLHAFTFGQPASVPPGLSSSTTTSHNVGQMNVPNPAHTPLTPSESNPSVRPTIREGTVGDGLAAMINSRVDFEYYIRTGPGNANHSSPSPLLGCWISKSAILGQGHINPELEYGLVGTPGVDGMRENGYRQVYYTLYKEEYRLPIGTVVIYDIRLHRVAA